MYVCMYVCDWGRGCVFFLAQVALEMQRLSAEFLAWLAGTPQPPDTHITPPKAQKKIAILGGRVHAKYSGFTHT